MSIEALIQKAESGDPKAQYDLGIMYEEGREVPADPAKALRYLEQAANAGFEQAYETCVFLCLFYGGLDAPGRARVYVDLARHSSDRDIRRFGESCALAFEHIDGAIAGNDESARFLREHWNDIPAILQLHADVALSIYASAALARRDTPRRYGISLGVSEYKPLSLRNDRGEAFRGVEEDSRGP